MTEEQNRDELARTLYVTDNWGVPEAGKWWDNLELVPFIYDKFRRRADALLSSSWLAERDRATAEKAWDEGVYDCGERPEVRMGHDNPYRVSTPTGATYEAGPLGEAMRASHERNEQ